MTVVTNQPIEASDLQEALHFQDYSELSIRDYGDGSIDLVLPNHVTERIEQYQAKFGPKYNRYIAPHLGYDTLFLAPRTVQEITQEQPEGGPSILQQASEAVAQAFGIEQNVWNGGITVIAEKPLVTSAVYEDILLARRCAENVRESGHNHTHIAEYGIGAGFVTANTWHMIHEMGIGCTIVSVDMSTESAACAAANLQVLGIPYRIVCGPVPPTLADFDGCIIRIGTFDDAIQTDTEQGITYDQAISGHGTEYVITTDAQGNLLPDETADAQAELVYGIMDLLEPDGAFITSALDTTVRYALDKKVSKKAVMSTMFFGSNQLHRRFRKVREKNPETDGQIGYNDQERNQYVITQTHTEVAAALYSLLGHVSGTDREIIMKAIQDTTRKAEELGREVAPLALTLEGLAGQVIEEMTPQSVQDAITNIDVDDVCGLFVPTSGKYRPSTTQVMELRRAPL